MSKFGGYDWKALYSRNYSLVYGHWTCNQQAITVATHEKRFCKYFAVAGFQNVDHFKSTISFCRLSNLLQKDLRMTIF